MDIKNVLDKRKALEISDYIIRRNKKRPETLVTLLVVCRRFRLNQKDVKRIINSVDFLSLSDFAYKPPSEGASFSETLMAGMQPVEWPEAPDSKKIVMSFRDL